MAFTLSPIIGTDLILVTGSGDGSVSESGEVLAALEAQTLVPAPRGVLFDLRALDYVPSSEEARHIAATYGAFAARHALRMAYLAPPGAQYGVARMVQTLSESYGVAAGVFTTQDAALAWLTSSVRAMGA